MVHIIKKKKNLKHHTPHSERFSTLLVVMHVSHLQLVGPWWRRAGTTERPHALSFPGSMEGPLPSGFYSDK